MLFIHVMSHLFEIKRMNTVMLSGLTALTQWLALCPQCRHRPDTGRSYYMGSWPTDLKAKPICYMVGPPCTSEWICVHAKCREWCSWGWHCPIDSTCDCSRQWSQKSLADRVVQLPCLVLRYLHRSQEFLQGLYFRSVSEALWTRWMEQVISACLSHSYIYIKNRQDGTRGCQQLLSDFICAAWGMSSWRDHRYLSSERQ